VPVQYYPVDTHFKQKNEAAIAEALKGICIRQSCGGTRLLAGEPLTRRATTSRRGTLNSSNKFPVAEVVEGAKQRLKTLAPTSLTRQPNLPPPSSPAVPASEGAGPAIS
jgi:hypothetical protein